MTTNGIDIVEQLRGRMKFYHVGDPVRKDMQRACEAIEGSGLTAESVRDWLEEQGVRLTPRQRKTLFLED
jgi:hypothetical protein|tara:strand:- start:858 stop:1067 length:210 start_codon:yes stop_codon:yes gene_type:complete